MNYKEVKQLLKSKCDPFFKSYGYKGKIDSEGVEFVKKTELGAVGIVYGITDYNPEYQVGFRIFIGSNVCYRIFHHISKTESKYIKIPSTISLGYAEYTGEINHRFVVRNEEDMNYLVTSCTQFMEKVGFKFFDSYTTLESLDELLNSDPYTPVIYNDDITYRAIDGLIIAKVLNNPKFDYLVNTYRDIQKNSPPHLRIYERYVTFLQEHTREELLEIANTTLK